MDRIYFEAKDRIRLTTAHAKMMEGGTKNPKQPRIAARVATVLTVLLWLGIWFLAKVVAKDSRLALLPFYGLYPGPGIAGERDYSPTLMHLWAIGIGIVFAVLAWLGMNRKNDRAATAFLALFVVSTLVGFLRIINAISQIR